MRFFKKILSVLDDFDIDKFAQVIIEINNISEILEDLSRSILIVLPKKPGKNECDPHKIFNSMKHNIETNN